MSLVVSSKKTEQEKNESEKVDFIFYCLSIYECMNEEYFDINIYFGYFHKTLVHSSCMRENEKEKRKKNLQNILKYC